MGQNKISEFMPNYKQILIEFMLKKQAKIGPDYDYFNYEDIKLVKQNWTDDEAKVALQEVLRNATPESPIAESTCCPYCVIMEAIACSYCSYSRVHGRCGDPSSTWKELHEEMKRGPVTLGSIYDWLKEKEKEIQMSKEPNEQINLNIGLQIPSQEVEK